MPGLGLISIAQLKCIYTNAVSMGNKQQVLEAIVQQDSYDFVAITETWWYDSHDWRAAMNVYKVFREIGEEREVAVWLCRLGPASIVESSTIVNDKIESLWVKMRGKANKADVLLRSGIDHPTGMKR